MGLRQETVKKYLKIVQAHFYGASQWRIAEEMDISPSTVTKALQWYREKTLSFDLADYLDLLIEETRNQIQHLWAYIKKVQDGLPDMTVHKGQLVAEKKKHFPSAVTQSHKRIAELRQSIAFYMKLKNDIKGDSSGEEDIITYDTTIRDPNETEEEWEKKIST